MNKLAIACCLCPVESLWQLGQLSQRPGHVLLIGWNRPTDIDGMDPPAAVQAVIAQALTMVAPVAYLSADKVEPLGGAGLRGWVCRWKSGMGPKAGLRLAKQPDALLPAFDDPGFPWTQQGQIMLMVSSEVSTLGFAPGSIRALMEDGWLDLAPDLEKQGLMAVARPGVDGAVLGVLCANRPAQDSLLTAFAHAAGGAGLGWTLLEEAAFKAHLAA